MLLVVHCPALLFETFDSAVSSDSAGALAAAMVPLPLLQMARALCGGPPKARMQQVAPTVDFIRARTGPNDRIDAATVWGFDGEAEVVPPLERWDPRWRFPEWNRDPWWTMTPALKAFYEYVDRCYVAVDTVGPGRWVMWRRSTSLASQVPALGEGASTR